MSIHQQGLQRVIFTGGPGSGKSTTLLRLHDMGYCTVSESGREIIKQQIQCGGDALPWCNTLAFAELMLQQDIDAFYHAKHAPVYFFDRGIPDIAGYLTTIEQAIPEKLTKAIVQLRYTSQVFIFPPWRAIYCQDAQRKQSFTIAVQTYEAMVAVYQRSGYHLITVPRLCAKERAEFILQTLALP